MATLLELFNQHLNEMQAAPLGRSHAVEVDEAVAWARQHAPVVMNHIIKNGAGLWRGITPQGHYRIIDTAQGVERKAANTSDLYRCLIDYANPTYPQRSRSIICSYQPDMAGDYGYAGIVIPADNVRAARTSEGQGDMWLNSIDRIADVVDAVVAMCAHGPEAPALLNRCPGRSKEATTVGQWNEWAGEAARMCREGAKRTANLDLEYICNSAFMHKPNPKAFKLFMAAATWLTEDSPATFMDTLSKHANLSDYGCVRIDSTQAANPDSEMQSEVWVQGKCLWVGHDWWEEFMTAYRKPM